MNPLLSIQTRTHCNSVRYCPGRLRRPLGVILLLSALAGTAKARDHRIVPWKSADANSWVYQDSWAASSFQTDNEAWSLSSISVAFGGFTIGSTTADLRLYSDVGGKPGVSSVGPGSVDPYGGQQCFTTDIFVKLDVHTQSFDDLLGCARSR